MNKSAIIVMLLLLFSIKATAHTPEDELEQLASIMMANEFHIDEWNVTIKERLPINKALKMVEKLEQDNIVTLEENKKVIKYKIQIKNKDKLLEKYEIIIPKGSQAVDYANVIVIVHGSGWNDQIQLNYQNKIMSLKRHYFTEFARKYVCLYTTKDAIIDNNGPINDIKQQLDLIHTSTQVDTEENSTYDRIIYGYTPLWKQVIQIDEKPMNVQIVVKKTKNNQTKLMIGTPILLNEY